MSSVEEPALETFLGPLIQSTRILVQVSLHNNLHIKSSKSLDVSGILWLLMYSILVSNVVCHCLFCHCGVRSSQNGQLMLWYCF